MCPAIHYLHNEVEILHNDVTLHNVVIDTDHIVLIDFGQATRLTQARLYYLGEMEKQDYLTKYPHIAPEVIYGQRRQSIYSDMYSVGYVLYCVCDHSNISVAAKKTLTVLAEKCKSIDFSARPKTGEALKYFQDSYC